MAATLTTTVSGASSNSYVSVSDADAYFATTPRASRWEAVSTDDKANFLLEAMLWVENQNYMGSRATTTQALEWPRIGGVGRRVLNTMTTSSLIDQRGREWVSTAIPQPVKDAQCEMALALAINPAWQDDAYLSRTVSAGGTELQVATGRDLGALAKMARMKLSGLLLASRTLVKC